MTQRRTTKFLGTDSFASAFFFSLSFLFFLFLHLLLLLLIFLPSFFILIVGSILDATSCIRMRRLLQYSKRNKCFFFSSLSWMKGKNGKREKRMSDSTCRNTWQLDEISDQEGLFRFFVRIYVFSTNNDVLMNKVWQKKKK